MSLNRKQEGAISFMPTEIISQILSDDCLEAADLCRLSLTNKRLMQALQPILYNHIVLLSDQPMAVERLLRSLNENAHLRALLRHLRLRSTPTCGWVAFPQSINLAFERILGFHLPALESLILEMPKIDINVYKISPTLPVRSIFINHASVEQAVMLLLLPQIEKIHIACIDDTNQLFYALDDHTISHFIPPKKSRFSTVRHIRIDQGFGPHTSLSPFIEWPRELQSLRISIDTVNGLSPISVDNHLEPVRETLQDLSIVAYTNNVTFDNATFIHFEEFKHLAHLKITSSLLFRSTWNLATIKRTGIFRHLAISLETLTVFFDHLADAIVTGREDAYTEIETPIDYFWILELTNLPKLRSLRLIEDLVSPDDSPNFKPFHWEPHSIIQNAFASHGIALEVLLRSYKQHNVDTSRRRARIMAQRQAREAARTRRS